MIIGKLAVLFILFIIVYMFGYFRGYDEVTHISNWGTGWDNWGVYALIERQPSIPAIPLDKLCEWLERYAAMDCGVCHEVFGSCELSVCNFRERWKTMLIKWMEE